VKPATIAIHVGNEPEAQTGAVTPPIYQTSTFAHGTQGDYLYEYTRAGNPNFTRLEATLASLEGGRHATIFGSGLGAFTALCSLLAPGDHVVASEDLYGGTTRLLTRVFAHYGVDVSFVHAPDLGAWREAMTSSTRLCIIESPTNPLLQIADVAAISSEARRLGIISVVDNTFATPIFQRPLALGADCVWHSTTKYIGGHSDVIGGAVIVNDDELKHRLDFARKAMGLNPSPFDAWIAARGLKTLPLRMERHQANATELATWLASHPAIAQVIYLLGFPIIHSMPSPVSRCRGSEG
jgi:cystathionine beta-lyase/cystathionine gamma-synthase